MKKIKRIILFFIGLIIAIGIDFLIYYIFKDDLKLWYLERISGSIIVFYLFCYGYYKIGKSFEAVELESDEDEVEKK